MGCVLCNSCSSCAKWPFNRTGHHAPVAWGCSCRMGWCRGHAEPARSLSTGERDGGERPVRVRLRVGVQWARVSGSGGAGSANARLLPHEEPQLRESHREGLLPGRWVHLAAVLISPAYNHYGEDHPEQYWWVTKWTSRGVAEREGTFLCGSIRSSMRSLPDIMPMRESVFQQGAGQNNQLKTRHRPRLMQLCCLLCPS